MKKKNLGSPENKDAGYIIENDDVQELLEDATESFYCCVQLLKSLCSRPLPY